MPGLNWCQLINFWCHLINIWGHVLLTASAGGRLSSQILIVVEQLEHAGAAGTAEYAAAAAGNGCSAEYVGGSRLGRGCQC